MACSVTHSLDFANPKPTPFLGQRVFRVLAGRIPRIAKPIKRSPRDRQVGFPIHQIPRMVTYHHYAFASRYSMCRLDLPTRVCLVSAACAVAGIGPHWKGERPTAVWMNCLSALSPKCKLPQQTIHHQLIVSERDQMRKAVTGVEYGDRGD